MNDSESCVSRRALLRAFAATAVAAAPTYSKAAGFLRGGGDIRKLQMYSGRTGERIDVIYWIDGKYIAEAAAEFEIAELFDEIGSAALDDESGDSTPQPDVEDRG